MRCFQMPWCIIVAMIGNYGSGSAEVKKILHVPLQGNTTPPRDVQGSSLQFRGPGPCPPPNPD